METTARKGFVFTGWHMVAIMLLFFGTIISVNFYMAYQAVTSWSGLVVENTYVASQQFNGKVAQARALAASGISGNLAISGTEVRYELHDQGGRPVLADAVTLNFKRPVGEHQDFSIELAATGNGTFLALHDVLPGHWIVETIALRDGERILHHAERVSVHGERR